MRAAVERVLAPLRERGANLVLAISGGVDSMVLLHAAAAAFPPDRLLVTNFDHGTGPAAREAQTLVAAAAHPLRFKGTGDLKTFKGTGDLKSEQLSDPGRLTRPQGDKAASPPGNRGKGAVQVPRPLENPVERPVQVPRPLESVWREARWGFLRAVAEEWRGEAGKPVRICTGHTASDQVETVLMRAMRDAGARGLAALAAESSDVVRPLLAVTRAEVEAYARVHHIAWIEDPSNASRRHLRNRVRHDILPAVRQVAPGVDAALLEIGGNAAAWRRDLDAWIDANVQSRARPRGLDVARADLAAHSPEANAALWAALASRAGAVLDRRGAARLAEFTARGNVGHSIPLSGGWTVTRSRHWLELRRNDERKEAVTNQCASEVVSHSVALEAGTPAAWEPGVGSWRFAHDSSVAPADDHDAWTAWLPSDAPLAVRRWAPGDTVQIRASGPPRKVKLLLARAGITGEIRQFWPVVLEGDRIVWIPGVCRSVACRSFAATERSGRPALPFICAYVDR